MDKNWKINTLVYTAAYFGAVLLSRTGQRLLSAAALLFAACFLYGRERKKTGNPLTLSGLYALGLLGGEGIACLQLSRLGTEWTRDTWLSFYLSYFFFSAAFSRIQRRGGEKRAVGGEGGDRGGRMGRNGGHDRRGGSGGELPSGDLLPLRAAILLLLFLSLSAFSYEAWRLGFIPLFTAGVPHAYSSFHLRGLHYFTTLSVLVPSLSMSYLSLRKKADLLCIAGLLLPLLLSVLLVSRFQFLFSVILLLLTAGFRGYRLSLRRLSVLFLGMLGVYVLITIERAHSVEYLNQIFEMKNPDMPIFLTQPYMYIANNYDNFNVMTKELSVHSKGMRMLYPFFTLSGLKFLLPLELGFPLFTTKEELTTLTLLYDAWYDFGLPGVAGFSLLLGLLAGFTEDRMKETENPFSALLASQLAFYLLFSFFTTWFSNAASCFYLAVSLCFFFMWELFRLRKRRAL